MFNQKTIPLESAPPPVEHGLFVLPPSQGSLGVRYCSIGAANKPVIVVLGGISAGSVVTTLPDGTRGWWDAQVGAERAVDTERFRVLGMDFITAPETVTTYDQADALAALLNYLNIRRVHALVGASYGAMVGLAFAERFPERLTRLVAISGAHCAHPYATALRSVQRRILRLGLTQGASEQCVSIARALAMTSYRSQSEFGRRFAGEAKRCGTHWRFPVDDYLDHHGGRYASAVSPEKYLKLSESLDLHQVDPPSITTPVTLIAADPDLLVPPEQVRELAGQLGGACDLHVIRSEYGHDAFLKEDQQLAPLLTNALGDPT